MSTHAYRTNKAKAVFNNTEPSLTDQSQAKDTDINVIVKRYGVHGTAPGINGEPLYGDFTNIPTDLRTMIETSRELENYRRKLPKQLAELPIEELIALTPEKLTSILTPPAPTPEPNKDDTK